MSKETTMTFRLEPELKANFHRAADSAHRPSAQVLRDFMRSYVEQAKAALTIDPAEKKRREDAVAYSRASVSLEGFKVSPADEVHAARFIRGEIDMAEFVKGPSNDVLHER